MNLPATLFLLLTHSAPAVASCPPAPTAEATLSAEAELERMQATLSRRRLKGRTARTIEAALRALAVDQYKAARAACRAPNAMAHYTTAASAYALYVEHFPHSPHAHAIHYSYGELLYQMKDHNGAYMQYMKAVEVAPDGPHAQFCAESAVFAAQEQLKKERAAGRAKVAPRKSTAPVPPSPWDTHLQAALTQAIDLWPDGRHVRKQLQKSGWNHYERRQLDAASARFREVIARAPQSREAQVAADLMIDAYATREDYAGLVAFVDHLLAQPTFGAPAYRKELATIRERASARASHTD